MAKRGQKRELRTVDTLPKPSLLDFPLTTERLLLGALFFVVIVVLVSLTLPVNARGFWLGISVFVVGWMFTSALDIRNRVKQHTFDLMLRTRFEATFLDSMRHISKKFKNTDMIPAETAKHIWDAEEQEEEEEVKIRQNIGNVLNYYEMIAISVYYKDADEDLLREYFNDLVVYHYKLLQNFLPLWRAANPEAFVYLQWLNRRWGGEEGAPNQQKTL